MADEKTPKARIELESQDTGEKNAGKKDAGEKNAAPKAAAQRPTSPNAGAAAPAGASPDDAARDDGAYTVGESVRDGAGAVSAWVSRTFPGHENAFWGGVIGLLVAVAFFALGPWRTALIAVLVVAGVAAGQMLDGDPKIINTLRKLFSRNQ